MGTLGIVAAATLLLSPFSLTGGHWLAGSAPLALTSLALGGFGFALQSAALVYGRVPIVVLLFFVTPAWSALIGRYLMGWPMPRPRGVAIVVGIVGLVLVLGTEGGFPGPSSVGDWLA